MADRKLSFKQSDLTRAIKAVRAAGFDVSRIEIEPETGKIIIVPGKALAVRREPAGTDEALASQYKSIQDALERSRRGDKPSPIEAGRHPPATPADGEA